MTGSPQPLGPKSAKYALMTQRAAELTRMQEVLIGQVAADALRDGIEWCAQRVADLAKEAPEGLADYLAKLSEAFRISALEVTDPEPPQRGNRQVPL